MSEQSLERRKIGGFWKWVIRDEAPNGGSQPGFRTVQASFSWADVAARDPAVGKVLATLAADEQMLGMTVFLSSPMTGTDAALATAYTSEPGETVATNYETVATNANPVSFNSGDDTNGLTGDIVGAFALDADNTAPADLTGGEAVVTIAILGGS